MDDMTQKLGAILNDPGMMQQIMAMAQALGQGMPPPQEPPCPDPPPVGLPAGIDISTVQRIMQLAQRTGIDHDEQALLQALGPYLTRQRVGKLEKAMRAAKIAGLAATVLGSSGNSFLQGR